MHKLLIHIAQIFSHNLSNNANCISGLYLILLNHQNKPLQEVNTRTYFKNCKTIEDVKQLFKNLVKKLHPDNGGNAEEFKSMMNEYKIIFDRLKNTHQSKDGETYQQKTETTETPEQFAAAINAVINLDGIEIELVGSWIWLNGNTYAYRDTIKAAGYFWSSKHKKWYYNGDTTKSKKHSKKSFEDIEQIYGAEIIKKAKMPRIATA